MSEIKQVKVDNWGIYFLQRLKHFFNRTDYCDLTLQFQDNAQLKVHRLVLSACTEYFELLERTCEMYEDCLVMPDDLQADVVVPIVNFMYTGQLDFKPELLEKLYQTSQVMNMPVLTKLLDAHRNQPQRVKPSHDYRNIKSYSKTFDSSKQSKSLTAVASTSYMPTKRSYSKAFNNSPPATKNKRQLVEKPLNKEKVSNNGIPQTSFSEPEYPVISNKNQIFKDPRPTRYELPEELDVDNVFESSFTSISYTSTPLMVHPETVKRYSSKKSSNFDDASSTKRFIHGTSTLDIVECKKISMNENIFDDENSNNCPEDIFASISINSKEEQKDASQLFDQILDSDSQKSAIEPMETERTKPKLDHAKIISEVLKKYPHLVKSNKNIKLKILNTPKSKKIRSTSSAFNEEKETKPKVEPPDFTYEFDVIDSKEAAKLIAMGAENVKGPWICLICGTPGRALHFTSYYKFRRHLVEVHNEKPIPNVCEYCGLKSLKRNYILHHLYTKHGVPPPPHYNFPKCNYCNYIALTEAYLAKHKLSHVESRSFGCNVCAASFNNSNQLLVHIQKTGHKYSADRKINLQCIYCFKTFSRETNLYTHLKIYHKDSATQDGIIEESDEEKRRRLKDRSEKIKNLSVKYEIPASFDSEYENIDIQYQIEQKPDGNIHILSKSPQTQAAKHKILNPGFNSPSKSTQKSKMPINSTLKSEFLQESTMSIVNNPNDGVVMIDGNEYIVKENQLIPKSQNPTNDEYLLSNVMSETENVDENSMQAPSIEFPPIHHNVEEPKTVVKKTPNLNHQHIQIVVSNEEEYKALMSANHSIIFDDSDPNKTLTVLTAPQNASLEGTTIDLDNTQPNDMMIIQEEYPLNVSETVTAENPNIVVVYSHPVDDQNKQFQYITSQGIEAQFIQSSAMITHNYETVTTSTPVMSAHVMDTRIEDSWQSTIKQPTETMPIEPQLHQTEVSIEEKPIENFHNTLNNNQEISLPKTDVCTTSTDISIVKETMDQPTVESANNLIEEGMDQVLGKEMDQLPTINLEVMTNEQLVHKEIQTESANDNNYDSILMSTLDNKNKQLNVISDNYHENTNIIEKTFDQSKVNNNASMAITLSSDATQSKENFVQEKDMTENDNSQTPMSNIEVTVTKVAKEQIEHLTSEWTENDIESEPPNSVIINVNTTKRAPNIMTIDADGSVYVEESIENIQQEMAKQMEAIVSENTATIPVLEAQAVSALVQPNIETTELNAKEVILEANPETDVSKIESNTEMCNKSNVLVVNENVVDGSIPLLITPNDESAPDINNISTETLKITLENSDHLNPQPRATDHVSVITEVNTAANVDMDNVLPDLLNQTTKSSLPSPKTEIERGTISPQEDTKPSKQHTVITLNKTAHDKISSLLNDWEDNDSQQDESKSENELNSAEEKDTDIVKNDIIPEKMNVPSNDNIKNLVSDWDDDDDDEGK